jgi:CRISPR-associated endonuclease/helicase Cas3
MHSFDVAAVGHALSRLRPDPFARMADRLGWTAGELRDLWTFLLALHDIGKFALQFQAKVPAAWPTETLGTYDGVHVPGGDPGHGAAGLALLCTPRSRLRPLLEAWLPGWDEGEHETRPILLAPILGHHGRPVGTPGKPLQDLFSPQAEAGAVAFAEAAHTLLRPPMLPEPSVAALRRASWPMAGLTVIADWVGSNTDWFPYHPNGPTLQSYWTEVAQQNAHKALAAAGLAPSPSSRATGFRALTSMEKEPSPVQAWAQAVPLPPGPLLILIEDMMGGGKTEAALVLAHRLMADDRAKGIYFALPTMATANVMFDRIRAAAPRLYAEGARPSLTLAHGRANLHAAFRPTVIAGDQVPADDRMSGPLENEPDAAVAAPEWLLSETRKALLADLGVARSGVDTRPPREWLARLDAPCRRHRRHRRRPYRCYRLGSARFRCDHA